MAYCILSVRLNSLRCNSASLGFGSKVSMWLGPPSIMRKMQALAFASACGFFGASGEAVRFSSAASRAEKATLPSEAPRPYRASRRVSMVGTLRQKHWNADEHGFARIRQEDRSIFLSDP